MVMALALWFLGIPLGLRRLDPSQRLVRPVWCCANKILFAVTLPMVLQFPGLELMDAVSYTVASTGESAPVPPATHMADNTSQWYHFDFDGLRINPLAKTGMAARACACLPAPLNAQLVLGHCTPLLSVARSVGRALQRRQMAARSFGPHDPCIGGYETPIHPITHFTLPRSCGDLQAGRHGPLGLRGQHVRHHAVPRHAEPAASCRSGPLHVACSERDGPVDHVDRLACSGKAVGITQGSSALLLCRTIFLQNFPRRVVSLGCIFSFLMAFYNPGKAAGHIAPPTPVEARLRRCVARHESRALHAGQARSWVGQARARQWRLCWADPSSPTLTVSP